MSDAIREVVRRQLEAAEPGTVLVTMTETATYQHEYTFAQLATILDVTPTRDAIEAELDDTNSDYGTMQDSEGDSSEALLDSIMDHFFTADERAWSFEVRS